MNEKWMDRWMNGWMGLNTNLYNDLVGEPKPSILGAFISSVEHQERLVGTWEVGTPRRVVVVAKQKMLVLKKGLCGGAKSWGGGGSVLHAISPISEANWLVGGEVYKKCKYKKQCVSVLQQYSRAICYQLIV